MIFNALTLVAVATLAPSLASALVASPDYLLPRDTSPRDLVSRSVLSDCLNAAKVPILLTGASYDAARKAYNLRFSYKPVVVAIPTTVAHVQSTVKCASASNAKVAARSGGHSYAAMSIGGADGSVMIDLQNFQDVTLDASTQVATVGAGVRLGNMATKIFNLGGRGLPHGTCAGVGIGGHSLLGGFGLDSRLWGLTVDMIVEMTAVNAKGEVVVASATQNSDLYWALRGAGSSFAVVTQFKLKTFAAPATNINWSYDYTYSDASSFADAFLAVQAFGKDKAPKELGIGIYMAAEGAFTVHGVYYGSKADFQTLIKPLLAKLKTPNSSSILELGWIKSLENLAGGSLVTPVKGYDQHDTFYAKSLVTPMGNPLVKASLVALYKYLTTASIPDGWYIIINLYGGPGSLINAPPPSTSPSSTSSYAHRDTLWVFQFYGAVSPFNPAVIPAVAGMRDAVVNNQPGSNTGFGSYINYVDPALDAATAHEQYWGASYPRLLSIKQTVDPKGLFWNPQAVGA